MALGLSVAQPAWIEDQYKRADCMAAYAFVLGDEVEEWEVCDEDCEEDIEDIIDDIDNVWEDIHGCDDFSCFGENMREIVRLLQQLRKTLVWYGFQYTAGDPEDMIDFLEGYLLMNGALYECQLEGEWPGGWPWENGD